MDTEANIANGKSDTICTKKLEHKGDHTVLLTSFH